MLDQRDVDGELARALYELLGAVKRVNQDKTIRIDERRARASFFCDDRQVWHVSFEAVTDDLVRREVRSRYRRAVAFHLRARAGLAHPHDRPAGADRDQAEQA